MRRRLFVITVSVMALLVVPLVVVASTGGGGGRLDHQRFKFRTGDITTSSRTFHDVPGLNGLLVCARRGVSATVSTTTSGAPFALVVRVDDGPVLHLGPVRFPAAPSLSGSYTWVGTVGPFEANDGHAFSVQWKSLSGRPVTLHKATFGLLFQDGTLC